MGDNPDQYLARMDWARSSDQLIVQRLNRLQNRLDVLMVDINTGAPEFLFAETSDTWVDVDNDLRWIDDQGFLWTSDRDGFKHVYLYGRDGALVRQLTSGTFDVDAPAGVDVQEGWVFYTAAVDGPEGRQAFRVPLDGGEPQRLSHGEGTHAIDVSLTGKFYVNTYTRGGVPAVITVSPRRRDRVRHARGQRGLEGSACPAAGDSTGILHVRDVGWRGATRIDDQAGGLRSRPPISGADARIRRTGLAAGRPIVGTETASCGTKCWHKKGFWSCRSMAVGRVRGVAISRR